jgi:glucose-6-phosphate 1-dehydrogenase
VDSAGNRETVRDLESAQQLNHLTHQYFDESQIYRIDHYLGKETVQNLLVFRFGNAIFESLWNRNYVESVQIIVAEELGVEKRADYYEQAGALRDMVQNHLTQILTLIAMEVPIAFTTDAIHFEKIKVLRSIKGINPEDVVFGQYTSGTIDGNNVRGYLEEPGVNPKSRIETFVAMKLNIDNWRWQGVPFYICTGKRLPQKMTRIYINFRRAPICLFESMGTCPLYSNALIITIQPEESYALNFEVKIPGEPFNLQTFPLEFKYNQVFNDIPEAYQTLLYDVLIGDRTLFVPAELVEASWQLYTPLLDGTLPVYPYPAGSRGPDNANHLLVPNIFHTIKS